MAKRHKYMRKRGKKYEIRVPVPADIQGIIGKREITRSLKTEYEPRARIKYLEVLAQIEDKFDEARSRRTSVRHVSLVGFDPEAWAHKWFQREYQDMAQVDNGLWEEGEKDAYIYGLKQNLVDWTSGDYGRYAADLEPIADSLIREACNISGQGSQTLNSNITYNIDYSHPKYSRLVELIRKGRVELAENMLRVLGEKVAPRPQSSIFDLRSTVSLGSAVAMPAMSPSITHSTQPITLAELIETYFDEPRQKAHSNPKTLGDKRAAFRFLTEMVGENEYVQNLTRQHFKSILKLLEKFPANARKPKRTKNMSLNELVEDAKTHNRPIISYESMNKRLTALKSLMRFATDEGYIVQNPCQGIKAIDPAPTARMDRRPPYSDEQLQMWLSPDVMKDAKRRGDAFFWAPLLGLFQGFRMEEILQLKADDVQKEEETGIAYFNIHGDHGNFLKTVHSRRRVPIHDELIKLGILKFAVAAAKKPDKRLFSHITKGQADRYSKNFSPKISAFMKKHGFKTKKTSFHSLRHNFKDALRNAGVSVDRSGALGGWSEGASVQSNYGSGFSLTELNKEIQKVTYPKLDLSHLYVK